MKFLILQIVLFILLLPTVQSQTDSSNYFVPDRPGMATPPNILKFKNLQFEEGSQYEKFKHGKINNDNFLFFSPLLRYGISKKFEVRVQTDFVYNREKDSTAASTVDGFNPVTIGSKIKLLEQQKVLPDISLMLNLTLPFVGKKEFRPDHIAPSLFLLMANSISEKLNLCYNYGLLWDGSSSVPTHFYAICLGINLNNRLSTFIETFGYFNKLTTSEYYIDSGLAYLINDHLQIDFSATGYLNSFFNNYTLNAGIAWKILQPKLK